LQKVAIAARAIHVMSIGNPSTAEGASSKH